MCPSTYRDHCLSARMTLLDRLKVLVERYFVVVCAVPGFETIGCVDGCEGVHYMGVGCSVKGGRVHSLAVFVAVNAPTLPIADVDAHLGLFIAYLLKRHGRRPRGPLGIAKGIHQTVNINSTTLRERKATVSIGTFISTRTGYGILAISINLLNTGTTEKGGFKHIHILHTVTPRVFARAGRRQRLTCGWQPPTASKGKAPVSVLTLQNIPAGTRPHPLGHAILTAVVQLTPIRRAEERVGGRVTRNVPVDVVLIRRP